MIGLYNCRPGRPIKWTPDNIPARRARWHLQKLGSRGRRALSPGDALEIAQTLRRGGGETLKGVAEEVGVSPTFLKDLLAEHGHTLNFYYRTGE